ncbi:MAG: gamma-glutamylcyclotransferase [Bacteroidetes bacterium]|nr:gamma-glutamylcyclotransferase [Bacteroidota bacterium]
MTEKLFVYGTLKRDQQHNEARFLSSNSNFLGAGKIKGQLFDLGNYPGLTLPENADTWVFGEVFEIEDVNKVLRVIDEYEGDEFDRVEKPVFVGDQVLNCWVYLFNRNTSLFPRLTEGIY